MRHIALRGLLGRKRDTFVLCLVITLAFLFLTISTTLISSIEATDAVQRTNTYGTWQVMVADTSVEDARRIAEKAQTSAVLPMIGVSGNTYLSADNEYYISTYTPELAQLGQFSLREGRWPESRNEIVMEYSRMSSDGLKVGDEVTLMCQFDMPAMDLYEKEKSEYYRNLMKEERQKLLAHYRQVYADHIWRFSARGLHISPAYTPDGKYISGALFLSDGGYAEWGSYDMHVGFFGYWMNCYQQKGYLFADEEHPDGQIIHLDDLTEEQFMLAVEDYTHISYVREQLIPPTRHVAALFGLDELIIRLKYMGTDLRADALRLSMSYTYTITGVIDTYTDRWDSGKQALPQGFVTHENYEILLAGQQLVIENYPDFQPVEFDAITLLSNGIGTSVNALWEDILPEYNLAVLSRTDFAHPSGQQWGTHVAFDEDGRAETVEAPVTQIKFVFQVADQNYLSSSTVETISAWLVLPGYENSESIPYLSDHLLDETYGVCAKSVTGSLSDLVEITDDYFRLRQSNSSGGFTVMGFDGDLKSSTVVFDYQGQRFEVPLEQFVDREFTLEGKIPVVESSVFIEDLQNGDEFDNMRFNHFAYPPSTESNHGLLLLVIGILFVTTVCAVFQIFFSQIRRRLRRIVLLKSVGAETNQIARMLLWEFLFFLVAALPAGSLLGIGGARIATDALSHTQNRTVLMTINPAVLAAALAMGIVALLLGMAVPTLMAIGVPLTGRTARKKPLPPPKRDVRQSFLNVTIRGLVANKGRTAGSFALCAFMMLIGALCLFLGFRQMSEYRDTVVRDGVPDYRLRSPYAMSVRQRSEYIAALSALGVTESIDTYLVGEDITLLREGMGDSALVTAIAGESDGCAVDLWGLTSEDDLFRRLSACATVGSLDAEAYDEGHEVMLFIPLYREGGKVNESALSTSTGWERLAPSGITTSYYAEFDGIYDRDTSVAVGDSVQLRTEILSIAGESAVTLKKESAPAVGAILYYFPDTAIWPFGGNSEGYQIIGSPALLKQLLPYSCSFRDLDTVRGISNANGVLYTNEYGRTDFYINGRSDLSAEEVDTALLIFARSHSMEIEVYHESSEKLLRDAVNNILLVCLLGLTAVLLALVIFGNTISSEIEQERGRIGILQSLGVSNGKLILRQLGIGTVASLFALLVSNLILWGGIVLFAKATGKVTANLLWGYPIMWHIGLCAAIALVIVILYILPALRLRKYLPIQNIKTRK